MSYMRYREFVAITYWQFLSAPVFCCNIEIAKIVCDMVCGSTIKIPRLIRGSLRNCNIGLPLVVLFSSAE
ncbi:hypothetical protein OWV82_011913 [Melia azedarach]|uniref:Uncharacterized protein n=1 Tax=Melia azedarach TaxID=155640 RepID=A0ACC1Y351_MELAZ|nr:hypothetical protein OWV82_011913 [Melia azedarach]